MPAEYLVNLGEAQLYFDAHGQRCAPPGNRPPGEAQTVYFARVSDDGALLTKTWDIGLAEFTEQQRAAAALYKKTAI